MEAMFISELGERPKRFVVTLLGRLARPVECLRIILRNAFGPRPAPRADWAIARGYSFDMRRPFETRLILPVASAMQKSRGPSKLSKATRSPAGSTLRRMRFCL